MLLKEVQCEIAGKINRPLAEKHVVKIRVCKQTYMAILGTHEISKTSALYCRVPI